MKKLPLFISLAVLCSSAGAADYVSTDVSGKTLSSDVSNPVESVVVVAGVPANHEVSLLKVKLSITHTYVADLDIYLIDPAGNVVELTTDNGGSGENFTETIFVQTASNSIASVSVSDAPFTGEYRPEGDLTSLYESSPNGTWTLRITDDANGDVGTLDAWTLTVDSNSTVPPEPKVMSRPVVVEMKECQGNSYTEHTFSLFKKVVFRDSLREAPLAVSDGLMPLVSKKAGTWTNGEFSVGHAIYFVSGSQKGRLFPIKNDESGVLSIQVFHEGYNDFSAGDDYEVVELWSLNGILPSSTQTAIAQTTGAVGDSRLLLKSKPPYRNEGNVLFANTLGDIWSTQELNLTRNPYLYLAEKLGVMHSTARGQTYLVVLGTPVLTTFVDDLDDSDGDTLSDTWEMKYTGSLAQVGGLGGPVGNVDSDNDGYTDSVEQRLGFNPIDANHRFRVAGNKFGPNLLRLKWHGVIGNRYKIETSKNLLNWTDSNLGDVIATSSLVSVDVTIIQGGEVFYRVTEVTE